MVLSQKKSIQKKLLAATSMLLVACIMLISASYAWFTLSTAPEIKGITTTIGANGNLEIALADESTWKNPDALKTNVSNTGNTTWGNLIDVSEHYGLEGISLLPARLGLGTGNLVETLMFPKYGSDGRVSGLGYADDAQYLSEKNYVRSTTYHGVRIIGTSASMTERQLAFRSAQIALANAIAAAKAEAKASLEDNGTALSNIVMKKALAADGDTIYYSMEELNTIGAVLADVTEAQAKMLKAWESAVILYAASYSGEQIDKLQTEEQYLAFKTAMGTADGYEVTEGTLTATTTLGSIDLLLPGAFATYYKDITDIKDDITTAQRKLDKLIEDETNATEKGKITWASLSDVLDSIINKDKITINDIPSKNVGNSLENLIDGVLSGQGIQVQMPTGAGLYADIADFCGDYSATVSLQGLSYGDFTYNKPVKATMTTATELETVYFDAATAEANKGGAPEGAGANSNKLSDFYGYALDFYLRTNAANANLLLQVEGAQRIYSDSTNEDTLGGGSNMTFTSQDVNFTTDQMIKLMGAIRVVFSDGDSKQLLAVAALDTVNATTVNDKIVKANLKLCEYTTPTSGDEIRLDIDADPNTEGVQLSFLAKQQITSLPQNKAVKLTATVYLDGDYVTNDMVANALSSMSGNLNLQFATDQKLVPMRDTALLEGKKEEENQTP